MNIRIFLITVLIFGLFPIAEAQKIWTLDDCITYALDNNIDLKKADLNNQRNDENYHQSIRNLLPSAYTSVGLTPNFGKSIDPNTNDIIYEPHLSNRYGAGTTIQVFQGFTRINRIKISKAVYEAGIYDEKSFVRALSFSIMEAFYNALFYKRYLEISDDLIQGSLWNKSYTEGMIRNGLKSESDIYTVEAEIASAELAKMKVQNNYDQALLKLKQLINLDVHENLQISDIYSNEDSEMLQSSVESLFNVAVNNYPSILISRSLVSTAGLSLKNAQAFIYPTFSLGAHVSTGFYTTLKDQEGGVIPFAQQFRDNVNPYLSMAIGIPLEFNKGYNRSQIKLANINLRDRELDLLKEEQKLYKNIQQDWQKVLALEKEIEQSKVQVKASAAAEKVVRRKFEKGLANQYELSQARNLLSQAKSNLLQARIQYDISRRTIEYYKEII